MIESASTEIARKVKEIIENVLAAGNWENSIFLKASGTKLQKLRNEAERLFLLGEESKNVKAVANKNIEIRTVPPGHSQVFILLYQVDGTNLQGWYRNIKTLTDYSVTRPAYKNENHAKEAINAKSSGVERNGYAVVNVKDESFYSAEQPPVDALGHQLFVLKENSINLENIVEFVHANKKHYSISDDELVLLNE